MWQLPMSAYVTLSTWSVAKHDGETSLYELFKPHAISVKFYKA